MRLNGIKRGIHWLCLPPREPIHITEVGIYWIACIDTRV